MFKKTQKSTLHTSNFNMKLASLFYTNFKYQYMLYALTSGTSVSKCGQNKLLQTRWLTATTKIYYLTVMETRNSKIKVLSGLIPSGDSEGKNAPCLSSSFWLLPVILGIHSLAYRSITSIFTFIIIWCFPWVPVSLSKYFSPHKDTSRTRFRAHS